MFNFKEIKSEKITKQSILRQITESQIFYYYFGSFKIGKRYPSIFRKDINPSTCFFINKTNNRLNYYDFTDNSTLDCFAFVQKMYNCDFITALTKIASDFGLLKGSAPLIDKQFIKETSKIKLENPKKLIQFTYKKYTKEALKYWNYYEISEEELIKDNVYFIDKLFLNKTEIKNYNNFDRFAKCEEKNGEVFTKIYSPLDKNLKWLSSIPLDLPFGINNLSFNSPLVIITKSFKDRIVLKKFFKDVIATQNESVSAINQDTLTILQDYKRKILFWDNDDPGIKNANLFQKEHSEFEITTIPKFENFTNIKDPSEYIKIFGYTYLKELLEKQNLLC